jgi:dihydrofolate reductase
MANVVVVEHLTLDGVMQSPGHADEDPRDGFAHGGWAARLQHPLMQQAIGARMGDGWSLLVGRTTYVRFADFWPKQAPNPFTDALNQVRKYVASNTLHEPLPWHNSVLLSGDAADSVARLKREQAGNLVVFGSGELVRSLMQRSLVDEFVLLTHPLVLGTGRRLFLHESSELELLDSVTTPTGVIVATYRAGASSRTPECGSTYAAESVSSATSATSSTGA